MLRLICLFLFLGVMSVNGTVNAQQEKVTLENQKMTLGQVFNAIVEQHQYDFFYSNDELNVKKEVTLAGNTMSVEELLKATLGSNYNFRIVGKTIIITPVSASQQAKFDTVRGVVKSNKELLPGAAVIIKGTTTGTVTNVDGRFTLALPNAKNVTLLITFMGMKPQQIVYTGQKELVINMEEDIAEMEEVVVTGYFNRSSKSYTGNAVAYTGDEIRQISTSNVLQSLSMLEPSFKMIINNEYGSDPNRIPDFQIQGPTNLQNEYSNTPNMPTFILDGFEVSAQKVFDLDPNQIQSMTVLKDAAATAIYGSRAANGVVVIETIAPKEGNLRFSYSFSGDFEMADLSSYNLMNAAEKLQYEKIAGLYTQPNGYPPSQETLDAYYNAKLVLVQKGVNTEWIKKPVEALGFSNKHTVSLQGGSSSFRYNVDLSYRRQTGIMKESGRNNYGLGVKIQYVYEKLKFSNALTYGWTKQYNSPYGSFAEYTRMNPFYLPYDGNGNVLYQMYQATNNSEVNVYNPMFNATINTKDESDLDNIADRFSVEYQMAKGLILKANASYERSMSNSDIFKPGKHTSFAESGNKGSYQKTTAVGTIYDITASALYSLATVKHVLSLAVVYNVRETKDDSYSVTAYNFPNDHFDHISMAVNYQEGDRPGGSVLISRLMGGAFNANYIYDSRYLFDFSIRSDASSVFGSNKRWGTFYSVGAGWNMHNEHFIKGLGFIDNLKLKASYGTTGGQNFNPYQAMMMYSYKIMSEPYGGELGALAMAYGNKDLKWQITKKLNVGVDFTFFDNRISGAINRYSNLTEGKLIDFTLAPSTGFTTYTVNLGNVLNQGWEGSIKATIIKQKQSGLYWDLLAKVITNKNKLREINDALTAYNEAQNEYINSNIDNPSSNKPVVKYMEGHSINTIWANESLGIDPATGEEIFVDLLGRKTNIYDVRNDKPIATTDPEFEGSLGTIVSYRGFSLNAIFSYSYGAYLYNETLVNKIENVSPQFNGDKRILYGRWQKPGDVAAFKNISNKTKTHPTSRFVEKENFVRLSSLNLSYQFKPEVLKKIGIEMLRLSAITNDLFRISTVKMERGIYYPFARTISLNLQLTL